MDSIDFLRLITIFRFLVFENYAAIAAIYLACFYLYLKYTSFSKLHFFSFREKVEIWL